MSALNLTYDQAAFLAKHLDGVLYYAIIMAREKPQDAVAVASFLGMKNIPDLEDKEIVQKIDPLIDELMAIRKQIKDDYDL